MPRLCLIVLVLVAASLAGCVSPTPYQPADSSGANGYTTQKIENNRYRVSFNGNTATSRQTVEQYLIYLASQVTLQNGDDYFVMLDRNTDKSTSYQTTYSGFGGGWGWGRRGFIGAFPGDDYTRPINEYGAVAEILTFKGQKPANDPRAYDAHEVAAQIGPSIVLPKAT